MFPGPTPTQPLEMGAKAQQGSSEGAHFSRARPKLRAEACHAGGQRRRHGGKSAWAGALGYLRHNLGVREALVLRTSVRG